MSERSQRFIGLYAVIAALGSAIIAPLLALAYFHIEDGQDSLNQSSVSFWADPAYRHLHGLLTFGSPNRVYTTYLGLIALLFPAVILCAWIVRSQRTAPLRGSERWGWRIALAGYVLAGVGLTIVAVLATGGASPNSSVINVVFLALMIPGMLITMIGSTVLGIGLLRSGFAPKATAWLLAFSIPFMIVGSALLGHNSLGMVSLFVAWGIAGWRLWSAGAYADATASASASLSR